MSGVVSVLRGAGLWARRFFKEPEVPLAAIEVRPRSVGIVRARRDKGRLTVAAVASLDLPEGALNLSLSEPNLVAPEAFRDTLRSLAEKAGLAGGGQVALVLPDTAARVALLPVGEIKARGRAEIEEMLRFRLRKSVPFDTRASEVACVLPGGTGTTAVAAAISRPVLEQYEDACRSLDLHPGLVELSGLALLAAHAGTTGDHLLVNWEAGYVSLILSRDGWPLLVRTLVGEPAGSTEEVAREVANTSLYYRERLGGAGLQSALLRSGLLPPEEALAVVSEGLGSPAQLLPGPPGLAEGAWSSAQAVAGAAACVLREAA